MYTSGERQTAASLSGDDGGDGRWRRRKREKKKKLQQGEIRRGGYTTGDAVAKRSNRKDDYLPRGEGGEEGFPLSLSLFSLVTL